MSPDQEPYPQSYPPHAPPAQPGYPAPDGSGPGYPPPRQPYPATPQPYLATPQPYSAAPGYPTPQPHYPPPQQTPQYQPQYAPGPLAHLPPGQSPGPARRRSGAVVPLAVVVGLLVLGLVGTGISWVVRSTSRDRQIAQLKDDHAAHVRAKADDEAARKARLEAADLPAKFAAVKAANDRLDAEVTAWADRSVDAQLRTIHISQELRSACLEAVIAYNRAAVPFRDEERDSLPAEVNLSDPVYNCLVDTSTA